MRCSVRTAAPSNPPPPICSFETICPPFSSAAHHPPSPPHILVVFPSGKLSGCAGEPRDVFVCFSYRVSCPPIKLTLDIQPANNAAALQQTGRLSHTREARSRAEGRHVKHRRPFVLRAPGLCIRDAIRPEFLIHIFYYWVTSDAFPACLGRTNQYPRRERLRSQGASDVVCQHLLHCLPVERYRSSVHSESLSHCQYCRLAVYPDVWTVARVLGGGS